MLFRQIRHYDFIVIQTSLITLHSVHELINSSFEKIVSCHALFKRERQVHCRPQVVGYQEVRFCGLAAARIYPCSG